MKRFGVLTTLAIVFGLWLMTAPALAGDKKSETPKKQTPPPAATADPGDTVYTGGPRAHFPETTHDFGKVKQRESLTHVFKVQNTGEAVLRIEKVHAS